MPDQPIRCWWARSDPLLADYHDEEWGRPEVDEVRLFEMLTLEGAQAGLSWLTILRKREGYRRAFHGFDPVKVAAFDDGDRERLMVDASIVRNRLKIDATIANARAFLAVAREFASFRAYLAAMVPQPPATLPRTATAAVIPVTTPVSDDLSRDLKSRSFKFVGSTIVYSFMQAVGLVDDHLPDCFLYRGSSRIDRESCEMTAIPSTASLTPALGASKTWLVSQPLTSRSKEALNSGRIRGGSD